MKKSNEIFASADFPVIVARAKNSKGDVKVRTFSCKDSGKTVISNYSAKPFSPITGGKLVPQDKKLLTLTSAEIDHLPQLGICPNCGAELHAHASLAKELVGSNVHCVVCGEELQVLEESNPTEFLDKLAENYNDANDNSMEGEPQTTQMVDQTAEEEPMAIEIEAEEAPAESEAPVEEVVEEEVVEVPVEESSVEEEPTSQMEDNTAEKPAEVDPEVENAPSMATEERVEADISEEQSDSDKDDAETTQMKSEEVDAETCPECGEEECVCEESKCETKAEEAPEEPAPEVKEPTEDEIRVDMLSRCEAGLNSKKIEVVSSGKDTFYYVMVANKPVATLHRSRASADVQEIFDNKNLVTQALVASIEKEGINKAVKSAFGLVPMILKVKASEAIEKAVNDKVEEMTTQMNCQEDAIEAAYQQSLGIAAVAVNKNLLEGTKNVLAEDLIENLEEIGVEDARDIVESSFKRCGEEYLRTIVAKASEYKSKSAEVRNELANTVMASNFKSGKINMDHQVKASVKASLDPEEVARYRNLFKK